MKQFFTKSIEAIKQIILLVLLSLSVSNGFAQPGTPTHFTTVWQGENGQNHINILVVSAFLEDLPIGANDEIAVFSGSICVGNATLAQAINPLDYLTFVNIKASQNDGTNNGFNDNDTILFKLWDSKNQKEMLAKAVKYRSDLVNWITNGKYSAGSTAVVEIVSYTEYSQSIPLIKGANLFSSYVLPENPDVSIEMKPLRVQGSLIRVLDENGNSYEYLESSGGWINKIGSQLKTEGYSISVNFNSTLTLTGRQIVLPLDIPLKLGWNYISFPRMDLVNATTVIQPLIDKKKLIKVQDEKGYTIQKIKGAWKNNIGNFVPGKGYKINVNAACVLTIQKSYTKSVISLAQPEKTDFFIPVYEGNGSDHMNINMIGLGENDFSVGDELAAFDGTLCVGSVKLNKDHFIQGSVSLIASFASNLENQDGFAEGHPIQILSWNKTSGVRSIVQVEIINGELKFEKLASLEILLKSVTSTDKSILNTKKFDVYPNPAKDMITIRFSQLPEVGQIIEITDISGKKIASREVHKIMEEFNVESQTAGLYLVKLILGSEMTVQKLVIK